MKTIILIVSLLVGLEASAKPNKSRKPAESHGGVMRSNAQFQAVSKFAINEGGDLSRVFMIRKRIDCLSESGAFYEVQFGGQNSQTGKESYAEKLIVLASEPKDDMAATETVSVSVYSGKGCR